MLRCAVHARARRAPLWRGSVVPFPTRLWVLGGSTGRRTPIQNSRAAACGERTYQTCMTSDPRWSSLVRGGGRRPPGLAEIPCPRRPKRARGAARPARHSVFGGCACVRPSAEGGRTTVQSVLSMWAQWCRRPTLVDAMRPFEAAACNCAPLLACVRVGRRAMSRVVGVGDRRMPLLRPQPSHRGGRSSESARERGGKRPDASMGTVGCICSGPQRIHSHTRYVGEIAKHAGRGARGDVRHRRRLRLSVYDDGGMNRRAAAMGPGASALGTREGGVCALRDA